MTDTDESLEIKSQDFCTSQDIGKIVIVQAGLETLEK